MGASARRDVSLASDAATPSPEAVATRNEFWEIVQAATSRDEYAVLAMYFQEGRAQEEIAKRIGVVQSVICDRISTALDKIRRSPRLAGQLKDCLIPDRPSPKTHRAITSEEYAGRRSGREQSPRVSTEAA